MKYLLLFSFVCLTARRLIFVAAELDDFETEDNIVLLRGVNFQKALGQYDNLLVNFNDPRCIHCKTFAPDYVNIAAILKERGEKVACAKVDASEKQELIEKYDVQGFPTLKLFRKGKAPNSYQGFRSVDALVDWVTRKIGPPAQVIEDSESGEKLKESADVVVIAFYKDSASNESVTFSDIADQYDDYKFGIVEKEDVATKLGFTKEGVKLFKKFDEGEVDCDKDLKSSSELKRFIQANSLPLVVTFDQKNAQKIFGGDIKAHNLLFISKSDAKTEGILEEFKKSAKEFKERVLFVVIDSDQDEHERIIEYFGLKKDELPGLRFIKLQEEMTKYKYPHDELVSERITEFVRGVLDGKIKPHLLSQELPDDWDKQPVKVLVRTNFDDVAFDKSKDVLVKFYAPWCSPCQAFAPIYDTLGEEYKGHDTVIIAKMDAVKNDLEHTHINSYPTIKLFKRETNEAVEYHGERTLEGLSEFIVENTNYRRSTLQSNTRDTDKSYINQFNRNMLLPLIKSIVSMDYFRYVRVNLNRPCQLWCNADKCNLRDCRVKTLDDPNKCPISTYDDNNELAIVNTELASDQLDLLIKLLECNDDDDQDSQYVDLLLNPERYTGYSGESAHRIWRAIYEENCFASRSRSPFLQDLCYEERLFYEAISGLHTSINIHLSAEYPSNALMGSFEPNFNEFKRRFQGHDDYIENLYKLFLIELQALSKSKPYFLKRIGWPDSSTKNAIQDLFTVVEKFKFPNTEDFSLKPNHISTEMAIHFRNITTTIIDCVACDKCKLWGKVQLRGLGTAFKILSLKDLAKLRLDQQEIVSLINAIARLSHSIRNLEQFRALSAKDDANKSMNIGEQNNLKDDCKNNVNLLIDTICER